MDYLVLAMPYDEILHESAWPVTLPTSANGQLQSNTLCTLDPSSRVHAYHS